jgi:hypothetical protein
VMPSLQEAHHIQHTGALNVGMGPLVDRNVATIPGLPTCVRERGGSRAIGDDAAELPRGFDGAVIRMFVYIIVPELLKGSVC